MRITFYPITDFTWHTKDWRFFLYRNNIILYLYDNIEYKVRVFPFLFSMYQWIEDTLGVTPVFNQIPVSLPVSMSQPLSPEGRWIFSSSRDRLAKRLNEPPPLLTTGE